MLGRNIDCNFKHDTTMKLEFAIKVIILNINPRNNHLFGLSPDSLDLLYSATILRETIMIVVRHKMLDII